MKPQQALSNIEDYLSSFPADVIGDNEEEFKTLQTVVDSLPVLISKLEIALLIWASSEGFYSSQPETWDSEYRATIEFLEDLKQKLELR